VLPVTLPWNKFPGTAGLVAKLIKVSLLKKKVCVQPAVLWKYTTGVVQHTLNPVLLDIYVLLLCYMNSTHTHITHKLMFRILSSGCWQSMGYKKMAVCFVCKSVCKYHSLSAVCSTQQMVTVPSAHIEVSLYTHAHTVSKEQSGT